MEKPIAFSFKINGDFEFQEIKAAVSYPGGEKILISFEVSQVVFNAADGSIEEEKNFTETWAGSRTARDENGNEIFRIDKITGESESAGLRNLDSTQLIGDYRLGVPPGPLLYEVHFSKSPASLKVKAFKNPEYHPDPEQTAREQKRAGWRMSFLKSGENPDDYEEPDF